MLIGAINNQYNQENQCRIDSFRGEPSYGLNRKNKERNFTKAEMINVHLKSKFSQTQVFLNKELKTITDFSKFNDQKEKP